MNADGEGDQLFLRPRNCGFYSGEVVIERGIQRIAVRLSSSIVPGFKSAIFGLGAGGLATMLPFWIFAVTLVIALIVSLPLLLHPYTFIAAAVPLAIATSTAPFLPFFLACVWGFFLRSGRAWFRTVFGVALGAIVALLTYMLVHSHLAIASPTRIRLFTEIFILSMAWLGTSTLYVAGFRMILPAAASVAIGTIVIVMSLQNYAATTFEKSTPQPSHLARTDARASDAIAPGTLELFQSAEAGVRSLGKVAQAGVCVELVFAVSFSLLMIFMFPIPVPKQP